MTNTSIALCSVLLALSLPVAAAIDVLRLTREIKQSDKQVFRNSSRRTVASDIWKFANKLLRRRTREIVIGLTLGSITLLTLVPRLSVEPNQPDVANNIFSSTFQIKNTGVVPLGNLQVGISFCYLQVGEMSFGTERMEDRRHCEIRDASKIMFAPWNLRWLAMDDSYDINLSDAFFTGKLGMCVPATSL